MATTNVAETTLPISLSGATGDFDTDDLQLSGFVYKIRIVPTGSPNAGTTFAVKQVRGTDVETLKAADTASASARNVYNHAVDGVLLIAPNSYLRFSVAGASASDAWTAYISILQG